MRYYILIGVVIAAMAGWSGFWFHAADKVRTELERHTNENSQAREWNHRELEISGFPFRIRIDLSQPSLVLRRPPQEFHWRTDHVKAVGHPWQPRHILLDLSGQHLFRAMGKTRQHSLTVDSGEALASVEVDGGGIPARLSLDSKDIRLQYDGAAGLGAKRMQIHARPAPEAPDSVDVALHGDGLNLNAGTFPAEFPHTIKLVDLQTTVTGLLKGDASPQNLAQWRDGGGTLEITKLQVQWGDMDIYASGSLALDTQMRAIGALTARIKGHNQLLDIAVASGAMDKDHLTAARAVLGLLAAAAGGTLSVPVRLQDGKLFLGPAPIARLTPIISR